MKKYLFIGVLCFAMGLMSNARAGEVAELDEAMTHAEKAVNYTPHRDAGHKALALKQFDLASKEFQAAADATAFAWVRARMLANAGFALARASRCKEALEIYDYAYRIWIIAEDVASGGSKWAKSRDKTIADIRWGLYESACRKPKQ